MDKNGLGYLELSDSACESCAGNRFTDCYNVKLGVEKDSAVKVTENRVAYDSKQATSTKSFTAGVPQLNGRTVIKTVPTNGP
ncbi:hypothetical protein [Paenibacillus lautus]|uniref:hypothetical protein n=1 Tax=Paenibacillus lautus TaxID=1401 RepID=UPI0038506BC0|nr:hypothetical protein [Cytobacillus firmus]